MGADQQRLKRGFATRASANNVPRGINTDIEPGCFHQTDGVGPALQISFRIGYTANTALRVGAEL